jgi:hypothetical protein
MGGSVRGYQAIFVPGYSPMGGQSQGSVKLTV